MKIICDYMWFYGFSVPEQCIKTLGVSCQDHYSNEEQNLAFGRHALLLHIAIHSQKWGRQDHGGHCAKRNPDADAECWVA